MNAMLPTVHLLFMPCEHCVLSKLVPYHLNPNKNNTIFTMRNESSTSQRQQLQSSVSAFTGSTRRQCCSVLQTHVGSAHSVNVRFCSSFVLKAQVKCAAYRQLY